MKNTRRIRGVSGTQMVGKSKLAIYVATNSEGRHSFETLQELKEWSTSKDNVDHVPKTNLKRDRKPREDNW